MTTGLMIRSCSPIGLAVLAISVVALSVARAQSDDVSEQIWVDYNQRWTWPSSFELYGDIGVRTELDAQGWGRIVVRPGVRGNVGAFRLSGGTGAAPSDPMCLC